MVFARQIPTSNRLAGDVFYLLQTNCNNMQCRSTVIIHVNFLQKYIIWRQRLCLNISNALSSIMTLMRVPIIKYVLLLWRKQYITPYSNIDLPLQFGASLCQIFYEHTQAVLSIGIVYHLALYLKEYWFHHYCQSFDITSHKNKE